MKVLFNRLVAKMSRRSKLSKSEIEFLANDDWSDDEEAPVSDENQNYETEKQNSSDEIDSDGESIIEILDQEIEVASNEKWVNLDYEELRAYIGLLLFAGVYRSYGEFIGELWDDVTGRNIFDDKSSRAERRVRDKLAPIRTVFDKWSHNFKVMYNPGENVAVDEQLVPLSEHILASER